MNTEVFAQDKSTKSYWSKPEGKIGTIFGLLVLAIVGYYVVPILATIVWNTVNLAIGCFVAFMLYYILLVDKRIFTLLKTIYDIFIKSTFGLIFKLDPFVIAEDYIQDITKERENLYDKITEVDGQKESLVAKITEKEKERKKQLDIAAVAHQKGMTMELANATRQVSRLDEYIKQLTPIKANLENIGNYLTAVHKNSKYMLEDMKNDLDLKKDLYKSVTKGNNALKSALAIFNGDPQKRILVEQSMEYLKDDIALKLASMKKAISYSSDFMKSIDLENASFEAEGLRMLEEYKPEIFNFHAQGNQPVVLPSQTNQPITGYDNLLNN
jgi:flagellar biosynthesis/type III secretory pathway chaperone